ncbi:MAG: hypothetical protein BGO67_03075 [Alphaproteobacteria bacterium 41-28]|nr:MAG: hypothetical protein BGO67_03075 [Alphaproteobacteria bacterium 41-28]
MENSEEARSSCNQSRSGMRAPQNVSEQEREILTAALHGNMQAQYEWGSEVSYVEAGMNTAVIFKEKEKEKEKETEKPCQVDQRYNYSSGKRKRDKKDDTFATPKKQTKREITNESERKEHLYSLQRTNVVVKLNDIPALRNLYFGRDTKIKIRVFSDEVVLHDFNNSCGLATYSMLKEANKFFISKFSEQGAKYCINHLSCRLFGLFAPVDSEGPIEIFESPLLAQSYTDQRGNNKGLLFQVEGVPPSDSLDADASIVGPYVADFISATEKGFNPKKRENEYDSYDYETLVEMSCYRRDSLTPADYLLQNFVEIYGGYLAVSSQPLEHSDSSEATHHGDQIALRVLKENPRLFYDLLPKKDYKICGFGVRFISSLDACDECNERIYQTIPDIRRGLHTYLSENGYQSGYEGDETPFYTFFYSYRPYREGISTYRLFENTNIDTTIPVIPCPKEEPLLEDGYSYEETMDVKYNLSGDQFRYDCSLIKWPKEIYYKDSLIYSFVTLFEQQAPVYANQALKAFKDDDYSKAIKLYDLAYKRDVQEKRLPRQVYIDAGEVNAYEEQFEKALELYKKNPSIEVEPDRFFDPTHSAAIGRAYYKLKNYKKSLRHYIVAFKTLEIYKEDLWLSTRPCCNVSSVDYVYAVLSNFEAGNNKLTSNFQEMIKRISGHFKTAGNALDFLNMGYIYALWGNEEEAMHNYSQYKKLKGKQDLKEKPGEKLSYLSEAHEKLEDILAKRVK